MPGKSENHELKTSDLFDVSHVTAVVTGGATGIGLMITQALVANGAKVYLTGRREEVLENTIEKYNTGPGSLHALPGDVSSKDECIRLAKEMEQKEPKGINLLVNNAGIARDDNTKFCTNPEYYNRDTWLTESSPEWPTRYELSRRDITAFPTIRRKELA